MTKLNLTAKLNSLITTTIIPLVIASSFLLLFTRPNSQVLAEGPNGETNTPVFTQPASTVSATQILTESPTNTLTPTETYTPTSTPTLTTTPTSTPTPIEPSTAPLTIPFLIFCILFLLLVFSLLGFLILNIFRRKPRTTNEAEKPIFQKESVRPVDESIAPSENTTTQTPVEFSYRLAEGYEILRELYEIASKEKNLKFVPVEDLDTLLKQIYPDKEIDLEQIAIEIANTRGGLLKIQYARYQGYLVKILNTETDKRGS